MYVFMYYFQFRIKKGQWTTVNDFTVIRFNSPISSLIFRFFLKSAYYFCNNNLTVRPLAAGFSGSVRTPWRAFSAMCRNFLLRKAFLKICRCVYTPTHPTHRKHAHTHTHPRIIYCLWFNGKILNSACRRWLTKLINEDPDLIYFTIY